MARNTWCAVLLSMGLLAGAAGTSLAQGMHGKPPQPQKHSAAAGVPGSAASEKQLHSEWRRAFDAQYRKSGVRSPFSAAASPASVLLDEGFEGAFPPTGWTNVTAAGGPDWAQSFASPHSGSGAAYSEFGPAGPVSQKYLVTKRVALNGLLLYRLSFWLRRDFESPFDPDTLYIRLSTLDSLPANFTTTLYKCFTGPDTSTNPNIYTTTYKQFSVTFTGVSGNAWLAFDHEDLEGQSLDLDDVQLEEIVNNDVVAQTVDEPSAGARKNLGVAFQPKATFRNDGVLTQTNIPVRFKIVDAVGTVVYNNAQTIASLAPSASLQVTFGSFSPSIPGNYTGRALAQNPGDTNPSNDSTALPFRVPDNVSGIKTVGSGGDFATMADAVHFLNDNNVAGPLTFSLISSTYTEPPLAVDQIHYVTTPQPVSLKPAPGVNAAVKITATLASPYGIRLKGARSLTIDGSNSGSPTRNLTIAIDTSGFIAPAVLLTDGCKNVTLTNLAIKGFSRSDGLANSAVILDTLTAARKDSNIVFSNLLVTRAYNGFYLRGTGSTSFKVKVTGCNFGGTGLDAMAQAGIVAYDIDSLLVSGNDIEGLYQSQGLVDLFGVYLGAGCTNAVIASNKIHSVQQHVNMRYAVGIMNDAGAGSNLLCYNNFLYDILSQGAGADPNTTIALYSSNTENTGERYYYNSIFLSGRDSSTSTLTQSAGMYLEAGVSSIQCRNNIIYSATTFAGGSPSNRGYCMYVNAGFWPAGSVSAKNDLFPSGPQGATGFINGANRLTLSDWQAATSQDAGSISADPLFIGATDLHILVIGVGSPVNGAAAPIAGITTDIDNDARNAGTPDIGADEFSPQLGATASFSQGWNIVSVPLVPPDPRKTTLFPAATSSAYAFEGSYVAKDTLLGGPGFWLKFSFAQNVQIVGTPITKDTVDVVDGWNLIGSVAQPVLSAAVASVPPGLITSQFFGYGGSYATADTLKPMHGYWVKVTQSGKLILAASGSLAAAGAIHIVPTSEMPPTPPLEPAAADAAVPEHYGLEQNYPNPFNPSTVIRYQLPEASAVTVKVYDMLGREVETLVDGIQEAGYFSSVWSGKAASGIYFCRIAAAPLRGSAIGFVDVKKMILMK